MFTHNLTVVSSEAHRLHIQTWDHLSKYTERLPIRRETYTLPDSVLAFFLALGRAAPTYPPGEEPFFWEKRNLVYPYLSRMHYAASQDRPSIDACFPESVYYDAAYPTIGINYRFSRRKGAVRMPHDLTFSTFRTICDTLIFGQMAPQDQTEAVMQATMAEAQAILDDPLLK